MNDLKTDRSNYLSATAVSADINHPHKNIVIDIHSIGGHDIRKTVLTEQEFIGQLYRLREKWHGEKNR